MRMYGHFFRYLSTFMISCIITLFLFLMMQKMLSFEQQRRPSPELINSVDFVRLIREPEAVEKRRQIHVPENPEPPEQKKPLPKMPKVSVQTPNINTIELSVPQLQTRLNLNDALYLGGFHKNAPMQQTLQVDEEVIPLVRIAPSYPSRAARLGIEGWVKMEVLINSKGEVDSVKILESRPSKIFNRAAIKAIKRWRFRPKIVAGKAVSRTAEQQINFKLNK